MTAATARAGVRLHERLEVLAEVAGLAESRLPPELDARARDVLSRARGRLGHGAGHTVVALAGATGSGKSSMFNVLAGQELAATGVRRPTTATAQAAVFTAGSTTSADAAGLLAWLGISRHAVVADPDLDGLVLVDLPDHDSTQSAHRQEVDRLVRVVDVFVWVVDPQKYADAALHHGYLRRFAGHADVTVVVLNQIDTIAAQHRQATIDDLVRIVQADGLTVARDGVLATLTGRDAGVRVMAASARSGEGIDELRREIAARTRARRAALARIDADVDHVADDLVAALDDRPAPNVPARSRADLARALAAAAGVDAVTDAVAAAHRRRGASATGWPPTRWVGRLKPDPLRRLGLDRRSVRRDDTAGDEHVARTTLPPSSPVATAAVAGALRRVVDDVSAGGPDPFRRRLTSIATARRDDLDDALDRAVSTARLPTAAPRWWRVVGVPQWLLAAALAAGLLWLSAIFVVAWLRLPDLPSVEVGALPLPTVLAVGGALLGLLVAALARWATHVGARRRASVARARIEDACAEVADELVIAPVDGELATMRRLHDLAGELRR